MEQNEILEGNKLIAEFMGYRKLVDTSLLTDDKSELILIRDNPLGILWWDKIEYHSSWDALMPVMFKIKNKVRLSVNPDVRLRYKAAENEMRNFHLMGTWFCTVKFIEWHNSQTTQS